MSNEVVKEYEVEVAHKIKLWVKPTDTPEMIEAALFDAFASAFSGGNFTGLTEEDEIRFEVNHEPAFTFEEVEDVRQP